MSEREQNAVEAEYVIAYTEREGGDWIQFKREKRVLVSIPPFDILEYICHCNVHAIRTSRGREADVKNGWRDPKIVIGGNFKDLPTKNQIAKEEASAMEAILNERGSRYGTFVGHAAITQSLKNRMAGCPNWNSKLSDSQREALEMIAHKIGRILNGDPNYADSWVDICGYSQLIVDELEGKIH